MISCVKYIIVSVSFTIICSCAYAQEEQYPSAIRDSLFPHVNPDGTIIRDEFNNKLDISQIDQLEATLIQQVNNLNLYLGKLLKTWSESKGSGIYSTEEDFYNQKKVYAEEVLGMFIYDGNKGVEQVLRLCPVFFDERSSSYFRYEKNGRKLSAIHLGRDENDKFIDSVYEDFYIPAAKIWVTNKNLSNKSSLTVQTVKQYLNNIQVATKRNRGGRTTFNGGEYYFTPNLIWNARNNRYEGAVDYWQEITHTTPEGVKFVEKRQYRILIYVPVEIRVIEGKTYVGWRIKFGNIKILETN